MNIKIFGALTLMTFGLLVSAQSSALEFTAGAGNPTGNGPTTADQVITFQNNTDNPTGNTFVAYTPTTTATFSLTNQQRTMVSAPGVGVMFGGNIGTTPAPVAGVLFNLLNAYGNPPSTSFTSSNSTAQTGIDVAVNRGVRLYVSTRPLQESGAALPTSSTPVRYQYADLVITFNQPVNNPIIHFAGIGANSKGSAGNQTLTSSEFELLTAGTTLTRLSGSTEFTTPTTTTIINSASQFDETTGNGGMSGSVRVNGLNLTTVTFRIFMKAQDNNSIAGNPTVWGATTSDNVGDSFTVSVSLSSVCNAGTTSPPLSGTTLSNVCPATTVNLNSRHNGTVPSGASLVWFTNSAHTGTAYATPTAATAGTYYAFYYDSTNNCYSPASSAVTVTITVCCNAGTNPPVINANSN